MNPQSDTRSGGSDDILDPASPVWYNGRMSQMPPAPSRWERFRHSPIVIMRDGDASWSARVVLEGGLLFVGEGTSPEAALAALKEAT